MEVNLVLQSTGSDHSSRSIKLEADDYYLSIYLDTGQELYFEVVGEKLHLRLSTPISGDPHPAGDIVKTF